MIAWHSYLGRKRSPFGASFFSSFSLSKLAQSFLPLLNTQRTNARTFTLTLANRTYRTQLKHNTPQTIVEQPLETSDFFLFPFSSLFNSQLSLSLLQFLFPDRETSLGSMVCLTPDRTKTGFVYGICRATKNMNSSSLPTHACVCTVRHECCIVY